MIDQIIFFNTGWMDFYKGLLNDTITGGGEYVTKMGFGHEILNYQSYAGNLYGYVQPKIDRKYNNPSTIKLEKLGALETDDRIRGITVVWTAKDPRTGGTYIVGWYRNATVYRYLQDPPSNSNRQYKNELLGYYAKANVEEATLLSRDERNVQVPRQKNGMGQSNVWYAQNNPSFVQLVKEYINTRKLPVKNGKSSVAKQLDPHKRMEIEHKAVRVVTKHYGDLGYNVESVEKDNVGWDLTATNEKAQLKLEVKGLSGKDIATELTPNEFLHLNADKNFYRLCIVTNALEKHVLHVFAFSFERGQWISEDGMVIQFEEKVSARVFV